MLVAQRWLGDCDSEARLVGIFDVIGEAGSDRILRGNGQHGERFGEGISDADVCLKRDNFGL